MEESLNIQIQNIENIDIAEFIGNSFACGEVDINSYSPLTLAYIGDCIFDLIVRTVVVKRGNQTPAGLHKAASHVVNAGTQCALIEAIIDELTPVEEGVYRRGRNAKSHTTAKNAKIGDYRKATGLEALLGYLYLKGQFERILFLVRLGFDKTGINI